MSERLRLAALARDGLAGPFDLSLAAGECLAITGASGSGKSLLLRMVADLDPCAGDVLLDGVARARIAPPAWRRRVGYLAADSGFWADRVIDHFDDPQSAHAMGERLGLARQLLDGGVARLSSGERQRIALSRTLLAGPSVLLLDEPTGALDGVAVGWVEAVLRERLGAGVAIVLVTHDPAQAARLGDRHLVMRAGRLAEP